MTRNKMFAYPLLQIKCRKDDNRYILKQIITNRCLSRKEEKT